eukprot:Clim_evm6s196 gene=Clim_evmTU6s196
MGQVHTVGPNEALVLTGGCMGHKGRRIIIGGWGWACAAVTDIQRISLETFTVYPDLTGVETAQGVQISVKAVAQCKFNNDPQLMEIAAEQFLGMTINDIRDACMESMQGHLRAIIASMSVEEVLVDREKLNMQVREVAAPDIGKMAIEIVSFTLTDVSDDVDFLDSLGVSRTESVRRDARIAVADEDAAASIREENAKQALSDVRYRVDNSIAENERNYQVKQSSYDQEVNTANANSELAYQLRSAQLNQVIKQEETEVQVVEGRKRVEIQEHELARKDRELEANVKKPAEANRYKSEIISEGQRTKDITYAKSNAEVTRIEGDADAKILQAQGFAEAESMRLQAESKKAYGNAAEAGLIADWLPKQGAVVVAPLRGIKDITHIDQKEPSGPEDIDIDQVLADLEKATGRTPSSEPVATIS